MSMAEKTTPRLLYFLLLINPFIIYERIQNPYEFPKFLFVLIIAQLIAICFFLTKKGFKFDLLTRLVFIFLIINFFADILGMDPRISLIGSVWRHQGFLLLLSGVIFYLAAKTIKNTKTLEKSILISGIILNSVTALEFISLKVGTYLPTYNGRVVATLGNPNFLGVYIVMILPFLLFHKFEKPYFKPLFTLLSIVSVLITQSRSAIIALITILIVYIINKLRLGKKIKYLLSFISIPFVLFIIYQSSFHRLSIWDSRTLIWGEAVKQILNKPILGIGQENFELVFPKHLNFKVDNAHNIFLETAISSGIMGLSVFITILILGYKQASFKIRLSFIAFVIGGFFNPIFVSAVTLFWILLGLTNNKSKS